MSIAHHNFKNLLQEISSLSDSDFEAAKDLLKKKKYKKGEFFIHEDKVCNHITFINSGAFRIFKLKNGEELNTCFCMENDVMSSFESFVSQSPATENIQALEESEVLILSRENLSKLIKSNPEWNKIKLALTEQECIRLAERANSLSFESALEKYQNLMDNNPKIIQRVSNYHIASYLGITRETLSRIRGKIS